MPLTPLISAHRAVLEHLVPGPLEACALESAVGRHLADPVFATRDVPGCDNSAMDGYAVRAEETLGGTRDRPARLRVTQTVAAGRAPSAAVRPGEAARIFTGAAIPDGADAVVRQEATRRVDESFVEIVAEATRGQNIRRRGEEVGVGTQVLERGQRLDAAAVGLLGSLGLPEVKVHRKPRVALVTVGDELLAPGTHAAPHEIFDSNGPMLRALVEATGATVVHRSRASDDSAQLEVALREALATCEVLISAGGASVGERDRVKATLRELGATFIVDGVALKPGKPAAMARFDNRWAAVLPGNPGAAAVAFDQLVRPLLLGLQGACELRRRTRVQLDSDRHKQSGLTYFLSASLSPRSHGATARVRPQGAGQLLQNVEQEGWVILPPGRADHTRGEWVWFEHLHDSRFRALAQWQSATSDAASPPPAVAFVGLSGSGKTTLIERLVPALVARGRRVAVLKHSSDAHPLDKPGSDTQRFTDAGAHAVAFVTPEGTQLLSGFADEAAALGHVQGLAAADLVLVEGWKRGPLPKIEVRRPGAPALVCEGVVLTVSAETDLVHLADEVLRIARIR